MNHAASASPFASDSPIQAIQYFVARLIEIAIQIVFKMAGDMLWHVH